MSNLLEIGEFQFENLVRNRIPFVLLNLGTDLGGMYPSFLQDHLNTQMLTTTPETAAADLAKRTPAKDTAVVVICEDGARSLPLAEELVKAGYLNVYCVAGGRKSLRTEARTP